MTQNVQDIKKFERYLRDPQAKADLLQPPMLGVACANVRTALRTLGYEVSYGDKYDEELAEAVLRF